MPKRSFVGATMHALVLEAYDGLDTSLRYLEQPMPRPKAGEVLVRIEAATINPSDLLFLTGDYGVVKPLPVIAGFEGCGTVVAVGSGVRAAWLLGRRVACFAPDAGDGTWAEYMVTSADRCMPIPAELAPAQAANMLVNPLTAWALFERIRAESHQAVIHTAAASQLGQMIARLGQHYQIPIIHVVRRMEQVTLLQDLGAQYIINTADAAWQEQLKQLAHKLKARLAFEAIAGSMTGQILAAMPHKSTLVVYGDLSGAPCQVDPGLLIFERKRIEGFWMADWAREMKLTTLLQLMRQLPILIQADLQTTIQAEVPLAAGFAAVARYRANMSAGKVVFCPGLTELDRSVKKC